MVFNENFCAGRTKNNFSASDVAGEHVALGFGHFILFVYFFPWPRSSKGPPMGRQFFKNVNFSVTYPLKGV